MSTSFHIDVFLPLDRTLQGLLRLYGPNGVRLLDDIPCRGKADNKMAADNGNPHRDPIRNWGDTPSGDFKPAPLIRFDPPHKTLGLVAIPLDGVSGDALLATQNGRTGLAIHANRGNDTLMATYGCIRVFDRDIKRLADTIVGNVQVTVHDCTKWPPPEDPA